MSVRRLMLAAALLLVAVYLRFFLPTFGTELSPALRAALAEETIVVPVPEAWVPWLILD